MWERAGPRVQGLLVDRLRALSTERLLAISPVALAVLRQVLRADLSGSTLADYKMITLHHGAVATSEELRQTRAGAIDLLMALFKAASGDPGRREVIHVLATACSMPGMGQPAPLLIADILTDARRIADFYAEMVADLSFGVRQEIEHDLYWQYRHNQRAAGRKAEEPIVFEAKEALLRAILLFRDRVNTDREFVIYKTLVGFRSVFPPAWDDPELHHADGTYRTAAIESLVGEVTPQTAGLWLERIRRCATTESNDMATFPSFGQFLGALGRSHPELMVGFLEQADEGMARFLTPMLSGLVGTSTWPRAEATVAGWVRQRRFLSEVAWSLCSVSALSDSLLGEVLKAAIDTGDDEAVVNLLAAASARYDATPENALKDLALAGIRHLGPRGDLRWVGALTMGSRPEKSPLLLSLEEGEARELLEHLVQYPRIEYRVEELIASLAAKWPEAVIDFFGKRLRHGRGEKRDHYDAVPYHLNRLNDTLEAHVDAIVTAARGWFDEDRSLFEYRGARLITGAYPGFSERLEALLLERVATGDRAEIAFVLGVLRAYDGEIFLHSLCKEIAAVLPPDDELLNLVRIVLDSMGVTTGEFGRVEGFRRKKTEIEQWLEDPREPVQSFARRHLYGLDQQIAAEQRRGEEDLALRKLEYGSPSEDEQRR